MALETVALEEGQIYRTNANGIDSDKQIFF